MGLDKNSELELLGKRIKELRTARKMTQIDLGAAINKDQQSIQRLEAGKINPSYIYLLEVCLGLGVSFSDLKVRD